MKLSEAILDVLEKHQGEDVSGGTLADLMGVSRTSVWKAVEELRNEGYEIDATTNRGYRLTGAYDRLRDTAIRAHLPELLRSRPMYVYDFVESTNQSVRFLALEGAPDGTVGIADAQSAGRGRNGRAFYSPERTGIYMSVLIRDKQMGADAVSITTAAAVAVARAIEYVTGVSVQIKWINDLYLNGRKICGILTDGAINMENGQFEYAIVGIGLNVHAARDEFPPKLREIAGSICTETGLHPDRNALVAAILRELEDVRRDPVKSQYMDEYRARSCVLGRRIRVYGCGCDGDEAVAERIDDDGRLIVRLDAGREVLLNSGEISIRPADANGFGK